MIAARWHCGRLAAAALVTIGIGLGCDRSRVEVVLEPRDGCTGGCGHADLSCVSSLEVVLLGEGDDPVLDRRCVVVTADAANRDLCDNRLAAAVAMPIAAGTRAVEIWGRGPGQACDGVPLFVATGAYQEGDDVLAALASCPLFCAERDPAWSHRFWIAGLVDGAPPPVELELGVGVGMLWDALSFLVPGEHGAVQFAGFPIGHPQPVGADGGVVVSGTRYAVLPEADRCLAASLEVPGRRPQQGCLAPDVAELPDSEILWIDPTSEAMLDEFVGGLPLDPPRPAGAGFLVGVVRDPSGAPVAGAQVGAHPEFVRVVYPEVIDDGGALAIAGELSSTGDRGWFLLLDPFVGSVQVTAPPGPREAWLPLAVSWDGVAARAIVLSP